MYEKFYQLRADPFALSPNPGFCYLHPSYAKARSYMRFALHRGEGFLLITGKPGTGKTTLVKELLGELEISQYKVSTLVSTQLQADDLLRSVAYSYGLHVTHEDKATILQELHSYLLSRRHRNLFTILIVDEAQDLPEQSLEELRLLTNMEDDNSPLLQIFLVGQPQLMEILGEPSLEQLRQRITVATALQPLDAQDVEKYVKHRLQLVGWQNDPSISPEIYPYIHQYSGGIPRKINMVCTRLLLHGYVEDKHELTLGDMLTVADELADEQLGMASFMPEVSGLATMDSEPAKPTASNATVMDIRKFQ